MAKKAAKKTATKKMAAKKVVKKKTAAKKTAAKKVVKKKTAAKKAAAKKVVKKKTAAKKTAAKKVVKKKTAAKKTAAKKVVKKKTAAKKTAAKKVVKKKTAAKKVAKKTAAKKVATKTTTAKKVAKKTAAKKVATKTTTAKKVSKKQTPKASGLISNIKEAVKTVTKALTSENTKKMPKASQAKAEMVIDENVIDLIAEKEVPTAPKFDKKTKEEIKELETKINDQVSSLAEYFDWNEIQDAILSLEFFVNDKSDECKEPGCDNLATTLGYCRLHYIQNWKEIQLKKEILKEGKLQAFIEELVSKYPKNYLQGIISDFQDDKEFYKVLHELNIATDLDFDDEFETVIDDEDDDIEVETREFAAGRGRFDED